MKSSEKKLLGIDILFCVFLFINSLFLFIKDPLILSFFLLIFWLLAIFILGYEKDRHRFQKDGILMVIIFAFVYQIITYLSGIFLGFVNNSYSLSPLNILRNTLPLILFVITSELLRYELTIKGEKRKSLIIFSTILFIFLDVVSSLYLYDLNNHYDILELVAITLIPSISKNILFTYWILRFGYKANILYRLLMGLPTYLIPILPHFNLYLEAVISFIYPIILFGVTKNMLREEEKEKLHVHVALRKCISFVIILFLIGIVGLTSGVFKYYSLAIGSGSMEPNIKVGDVVIIEKLKENELDKIKEGTILVFKESDKVVVHRVIEVIKENNTYQFKTKGDHNDTEDNWVVDKKDVIGLATLKIPYVGYPTIWLNELIGGV